MQTTLLANPIAWALIDLGLLVLYTLIIGLRNYYQNEPVFTIKRLIGYTLTIGYCTAVFTNNPSILFNLVDVLGL